MTKMIFSKDHKVLIEKIRKARENTGLNQAEVAGILKKSQSYISKVESGQRRIDIIQLKEFAEVYKKDLDYFIKE